MEVVRIFLAGVFWWFLYHVWGTIKFFSDKIYGMLLESPRKIFQKIDEDSNKGNFNKKLKFTMELFIKFLKIHDQFQVNFWQIVDDFH